MLELVIITFNRMEHLKRTIQSLLNSELNNCKISILDNCSDDGTYEYLIEVASVNENLKVIRNPVNIGSVGNVIRAYEIATEDYIWIVCDDDQYDFEKIDETLFYLEKNRPDALLVGTQVIRKSDSVFDRFGFQSKISDRSALVEIGYCFTFLPSAIVSKNKLHSCDFKEAFEIAGTYFPQLFWIRHIFDSNWNVHVSRYAHITRPPTDHGLASDFRHLNGYIKAVSIIVDRDSKNKMIEIMCGKSSLSYAKFIAKRIIKDRQCVRIQAGELSQHMTLMRVRNKIIFFCVRAFIFVIPNRVLDLAMKVRNIL